MRHAIHARWILLILAVALAGCAAPRAGNEVRSEINDVLLKSAAERKVPAAEVTDKSLMPPLAPQVAPDIAATEPRFDLSVVNAPATQVFMALVSGTRYSMLLPPDVSGSLTVNLKDVTVLEALDTIRELYGYEYRIQGKRIFIEPNTMKTRVFQINYLSSRRQGNSDLQVASSTATAQGGNSPQQATGTTTNANQSGNGAGPARSSESSRVSTSSDADYWGDLRSALCAVIGIEDTAAVPNPRSCKDKEGRSLIISPMSGVLVARALPTELSNIANYLRATQQVVERQVMIEAKIVEVTLSSDFQSGVNWAAFDKNGGHRWSNNANTSNFNFPGGQPGISSASAATNAAGTANASAANAASIASANAANAASAANAAAANAFNAAASAGTGVVPFYTSPTFITPTFTPQDLPTTAANALTGASGVLNAMGGLASGGVLGLAFQTGSFAALISFLETQGDVAVLSSPRIATLNNQKALLKVGNDEIFAYDFTPGTPGAAGTTTTTAATQPTPRLKSYFSGISLDVTPQIDDEGNIILHVHPSISTVTDRLKSFDYGSSGSMTVPLASVTINETDSVVRVQNSNIVAIGGLMRQRQSKTGAQVPGLGDVPVVGNLFGQKATSFIKSEMVILLKPTIISSDKVWQDDLQQVQGRVQSMDSSKRDAGAQ